MTGNRKCPCGDFQAGDPSDAHSARHTAWLNRDDAPPLVVDINRATSAKPDYWASEAEALADALPPYANALPTGESTSAALRRVEQERDELSATVGRMAGDHIRLLDRNIAAEAELASARTELDAVRTARDNLDRQLAENARASWIVARDGGRDCVRCGLEIRRGEAYELHNAAGDELEHIHCPDRTEEHHG